MHAVTLYNTCLLVHATHKDMMNSWKILCSEEFRGCIVSCSQVNLHASHALINASVYLDKRLTCKLVGYTKL